MKLVARKSKLVRVEVEQVKSPKSKKGNSLPPDSYRDEIKPTRMRVGDTEELVFSVSRKGDLGLPYVDVRQYVTTERYTGFTKKGITFPVEMLEDFIDMINKVNRDCEKKNL